MRRQHARRHEFVFPMLYLLLQLSVLLWGIWYFVHHM
jgi:hypothetical protein